MTQPGRRIQMRPVRRVLSTGGSASSSAWVCSVAMRSGVSGMSNAGGPFATNVVHYCGCCPHETQTFRAVLSLKAKHTWRTLLVL